MEADALMTCSAMEEGGDGVMQPASVIKEASAHKGPSWASIVEGEKLQDEDYLKEVHIREVDGVKELFVSKSAHEHLKAPFRFTAIATLSGCRSSNRASSEADLQMILAPGRWKVGGRVLVANRWKPGMPLKLKSSSRVRIWVRLPDLPPELWRTGIFHRLANMMGATFVEADAFTKDVASLGYARLLLEVPLGFHPVNEVMVSFEEGAALVQSIEYESKVRYCRKCGATSHFTFACDEVKQSPSTHTVESEDGKAWMAVKSPKRRSFSLNKSVGPANQANRFSILHSVPEREDGVIPEEGGTTSDPIPENARRKSLQAKEACLEVGEPNRVCSKEANPTTTKGAPSASIPHGQQSTDSMAIDETHDPTVDILMPYRKAPMEKKCQLKSKSTSSFKRRPNSHT
ncbi:hypothetical protein EJ110_NYTH40203 [Nymphaea thermarum]|nr:hypothetical protein EJ110_NYTH40203 [Nymphaea thermarum]